jgi:ribosomal-protein-alanine N-acetyltransferase
MIRPYNPKDKEQLINLLRLNTPAYFAPSEEKDYIDYLQHHADNYFLIEKEGVVLGAGGFNLLEENKLARISWDLVHPDAQGKGLGRMLTKYRIDKIREHPEVRVIAVRTSQLVFKSMKNQVLS